MSTPNNALRSAAHRAYADESLRHLTRALGIGEDTDALAADAFPTESAWSRMDTPARLFAISKWLAAECAALADDSAVMVRRADPLETVGTRD